MNRRNRTAVLMCTIAILATLLASSCATAGAIPDPADEIDISPPRRAAEVPSGEILVRPVDDALADAPDRPQPPVDDGDATLPVPAVAIRDDLPQHRAPSTDAVDVALAAPAPAPEPEPVALPVAQPARAGRSSSTAVALPAADPLVTTTPPADAGLPLPVAPAPVVAAVSGAAAVSVADPARVNPSAPEETPEPTRPATVVATVPVAPAAPASGSAAPASTSVAVDVRSAAPDSVPHARGGAPTPAPSRGDGGFTVGREGLDTLSVRFPGSGWVFVGNEHSSGDVTLVEKRRVDGDDVFVFRFGQPGEYHLWFQQQQPGGVFVNERVAVDTSVEPSAESAVEAASEPSTADAARSTADATVAAGRDVAAAHDAPAPPGGALPGSVAALPPVAEPDSTVSGGSNPNVLAGMSDTELFALAQRLERPGPDRDLRLALDVYELLVDNHPFSDAWDDGRARATFLRRHYFDIR